MDGVEAERTGEPTSARDSVDAEVEAEKAGNAAEPETEKTTEPAAVAGTDGVEIPRQQSAEEAADSEAGEGARA
ncbi:gliding motility protein [Streptomyces zaehneri]|uniref:gliding motility protein n=1 Tax=Streptomyces zaehneri TaxID=3051180 RepID=UPI0028D70EB3|nr:gliding motility protein [Streptomyces sp. DSM 40713]